MTDKEQAIEKALLEIDRYYNDLDGSFVTPPSVFLSDLWDTALQGRDEVIEECAEYLDSQAKVFDTRDWMVESSNTTRTLAKELRQLKGAKP